MFINYDISKIWFYKYTTNETQISINIPVEAVEISTVEVVST